MGRADCYSMTMEWAQRLNGEPLRLSVLWKGFTAEGIILLRRFASNQRKKECRSRRLWRRVHETLHSSTPVRYVCAFPGSGRWNPPGPGR